MRRHTKPKQEPSRFAGATRPREERFGSASPQAARRRAIMAGGRSPASMALYAWFFLTNEQQVEYAHWKESSVSGAQSVITGGGELPKNWVLIDQGTIAGQTAKEDVGVVGVHCFDYARDYIRAGGAERVIRDWATQFNIPSMQTAVITSS